MAGEESAEVTAVADASFLIGICCIGQLNLLPEIFDRIYVAPAVWAEVVDRGAGRPGADELRKATFIARHDICHHAEAEVLKDSMGPGEAETLVLARELGCTLVLVDDLPARKQASQAGFRVSGVLGFLLAAKQRGLIDRIHPFIRRLVDANFRLSPLLIKTVLESAGENEE